MPIRAVERALWAAALLAVGIAFIYGLPAAAAPPCEGDEKPTASSVASGEDDTSAATQNGDETEGEGPAHQGQGKPKWEVQVGGYLPAFSTKLRADVRGEELELGGKIDLEDDLGLDDRQTIYRLDGTYRLSRKGEIDFTYYRFSRSARAVLEEDIEFEGTVFPAGSGVVSDSKSTFYILRYARLLHEAERSAVYGAIGLHYTQFAFDIETTGGTPLAESVSADAPLPTIGFMGTYRLSPMWRLGWELTGMALSIGDYSGAWLDGEGTIEYFFRDNLAIGLGLSAFRADVDADTDDLLGGLEYRHVGPRLFGTVMF
jgi:hypothetical protein